MLRAMPESATEHETEQPEVPTYGDVWARVWRRSWALGLGAMLVGVLTLIEAGWPSNYDWSLHVWLLSGPLNPWAPSIGLQVLGGLGALAAYAHPLRPRRWTALLTWCGCLAWWACADVAWESLPPFVYDFW